MPRRILTVDEKIKCDALTEASMAGVAEFLKSEEGRELFGDDTTIEHVKCSGYPDYIDVSSTSETENYTLSTQMEW